LILIIAGERDLHARHVGKLVGSLGHQAAILDFTKLAGKPRYFHEVGRDVSTKKLTSVHNIDFADVRTIWVRRPAMVEVPEAVTDDMARQFIRHEWSESINGMALSLPDVRWVNHPFSQATASKPLQLEAARRVGLEIPDTLITNDPDRVRAFLNKHAGGVVHKSLTIPRGRPIDTRKWKEIADYRHVDSSIPLAPVIFQQQIEGPADIRSVAIADQFFSVMIDARTSRSRVDSRLDLDATYTPYQLPENVVDLLSRLLAQLGLVFGVIDMKLDDNGDHVFLEVNPQGQFLFMEILTQLPISAGLASYLCAPGPLLSTIDVAGQP
jgi:glutathione synthase/RimK-type ligase-like ATP-grasp enzyme